MKCRHGNCPKAGRRSHRQLCEAHYVTDQRNRLAQGDWQGFRPAKPVADHIEQLQASGISINRLSQITGIHPCGLRLIKTRQRVWVTNAEKILAVKPGGGARNTESTGIVPVLGPSRKLQSLVRMGYTHAELSEAIGVSRRSTDMMIRREVDNVLVKNAKKVDEVWRRLQLERPKKTRWNKAAASRATKLGWALPFWWDAETIDDPDAVPNPGEVGGFMDFVEDGRLLGKSDERLAEIAGMKVESFRDRIRKERRRAA